MSKLSPRNKAETFHALHKARGGFIMPNAWDAGSARLLAHAGFKAIATTSAGIAFSLGKPDYGVADPRLAVTRDEMLARISEIAAAVDLPVNGDLEAGYGDRPETVAETIRLAIDAGLAGGNIEDRNPQGGLYDEQLSVDRIVAAREAIAASGIPFVLTARTDAFVSAGAEGLKQSIRRSNLYRKAGADCLFAPCPVDLNTVETLVREIDGPFNLVMGLGNANGNANTFLERGAQRISLGGSIARSALGFIRNCAQELLGPGTIRFAEGQIAQAELNTLFAQSRR